MTTSPRPAGRPLTRRLSDADRARFAVLITGLTSGGTDDPTIAVRLQLTVSQVRGIRRRYGITPGYRR